MRLRLYVLPLASCLLCCIRCPLHYLSTLCVVLDNIKRNIVKQNAKYRIIIVYYLVFRGGFVAGGDGLDSYYIRQPSPPC